MNKEIYLSTMRGLKESAAQIVVNQEELKEAYIKECCPYSVGDKVEVTRKGWQGYTEVLYGFVKSIEVHDDGTFFPTCYAIKKDGTPNAKKHLHFGPYGLISVKKI